MKRSGTLHSSGVFRNFWIVVADDNWIMDEREKIERWVKHWEDVGPELELIRKKEIREGNYLEVLESLSGAFAQALHSQPMRTESGMVEMQRLFAKLRK